MATNAIQQARTLLQKIGGRAKQAALTSTPFTPQFNQQVQLLSSYMGPQSKFGKAAYQVSPQAQYRGGVDYVRNQVVQPIKTGVSQVVSGKGVLNRGMGALQAAGGVFSATPVGMVSNLVTGGAAGVSRSIRTRQPLSQSVYQGITTPTSFASQGLNIKNPYLALGVDVLTSGGDPRSLRSFKGIANAKGLFGRANEVKISVREVDALTDAWRGATKATKREVLSDILRAADRYLPKSTIDKYVGSPGKLLQAMRKNLQSSKPQFYPTINYLSSTEKPVTPRAGVPEVPIAQTGQMRTPGSPRDGVPTSSRKIIPQVSGTKPFFNTRNLNVSETARNEISETVGKLKPEIERLTGKRLSNAEVVKTAQVSSKILRNAVGVDKTKEWETAMLKARQLLADQSQSGTVTKEYLDNLLTIKTQGTDIARKLQSLGISADPQSLTAKQAVLEAVLKANKSVDEIMAAAKGVDFNDSRQATQFYRRFVAPKASEWIDLIRYNSMLSSPLTHIVNASTNFQGTGLIAPIEKTILGGVDFLKSAVTGKPREFLVGEGLEYAKGYYSSLGTAAHKFADVLKGKDFSQSPDVRSIPLATKGIGRAVENTLVIPTTRLLEATDQFFTVLTESGIKRSINYKVSKGVGVRFPDAQASQEAAERLFRGELSLEKQGPILDAIDTITQKVFQLRNSTNPVVSTIAKFSIPFVKTPMNIAKQSLEYSPLGFSTMIGAKNKTEQFTKALMGTSIGVGSALLLGSDRLTWGEPVNANQKAKFRAAGLQPYSVKIGDKWVSYSKLHPLIGFNLALVSAVRDSLQNQKLTDGDAETVLGGLAKFWSYFADQTYVKNIGDLVASARGDTTATQRFIGNYPQQLIPFRALLGWVSRIMDPYQRRLDPDGSILDKQLQQIAMQMPGLSQKLPARLDSSGKPLPQENRVLNAFSPLRVSNEKPKEKMEFLYGGGQSAQATYNSLKKLDPQEAARISKIIKSQNQTLYSKLVGLQRDERLKVSESETKIRQTSVVDRADRVAREIRRLKTPEEKNALVKRYADLGIITAEVKKQLIELKKRGEL